jgi:hypothetical protein
MATIASDVLISARTHLNDDDAIIWPDYRLLPKLSEAYKELLNEFLLNGIETVEQTSAIITVPIATQDDVNIDMSTLSGYPTDMIEPIWLKERMLGQTNDQFVDMTQCPTVPNITRGNNLISWAWIGNTIMLRGAFTTTQVQIWYLRNLTAPKLVSDPIVITLGETFLSYRTAALAYRSIGNTQMAGILNSDAQSNLDKIIRRDVKRLQNMPAKRRAYHRGAGTSRVIRDY